MARDVGIFSILVQVKAMAIVSETEVQNNLVSLMIEIFNVRSQFGVIYAS
jgi:hypothetical protein